METRRLGRTGHHSSVAILGGAAFAELTPEASVRPFREALDAGGNHLDVAPRYGAAIANLGPLIPPVRDRLFVAAKSTRRNPDGFRAQMEEVAARLGVEQLDLFQLHAVTTLEELDERAAAAEVLMAARDEGLTRFVGITGHDMTAPATHREALRRWDLDTVMFPVNPRLWADPAYRADAEELLGVCRERDVGVMAIKAAARRPWGDGHRWARSWYEPWSDDEHLRQGIRFALSVPGVTAVCTPGDPDLTAAVIRIAAGFTPMSEAEQEAVMAEWAPEPLIFPLAEHVGR